MKFNDLREYIVTLQKLGELKVIEGASCNIEIGAITELAAHLEEHPAVLFDSIKEFPKGYRIFTNFMSNRVRERLIFDVSQELSDSDAVKFSDPFR